MSVYKKKNKIYKSQSYKTKTTEALAVLNQFSNVAGPILNINKTVGMHIGKKRGKHKDILGIKFTKSPIKCLGIYVGGNQEECDNLNWLPKLTEIEDTLNKWKFRDLTLFGKVTVIRTLAVSKLTFVGTNCKIPSGVIKKLNSLLYGFIWGQRDRIKRNVLINEIERGGINMIDIESYFQSLNGSWIDRIIKDKPYDSNWCFLAKEYMNTFGTDFLCNHFNIENLKNIPQLNMLPQFYQDIILSNGKSKDNRPPQSKDDLLQEVIWGNSYIKYASKNNCHQCIIFNSFIQQGIIQVKDLKFVNGLLDETFIYDFIKNKSNIFREIMLLKKCLKPYKNIIDNHTPSTITRKQPHSRTHTPLKNGCRYKCLIKFKIERPHTETLINNILQINIQDFAPIYKRKIKYIVEHKIAEFNYKLLHLILPCNKNLKKWGKQETDLCSICGITEDIPHLIFNCTHAANIWKNIQRTFSQNLNLSKILLGVGEIVFDTVTSIIAYLIYKEWLVSNHNCNVRKWGNSCVYFKIDLKTRSKIYLYMRQN